LLQNAELLYP